MDFFLLAPISSLIYNICLYIGSHTSQVDCEKRFIAGGQFIVNLWTRSGFVHAVQDGW